jgi:hypothetical protein
MVRAALSGCGSNPPRPRAGTPARRWRFGRAHIRRGHRRAPHHPPRRLRIKHRATPKAEFARLHAGAGRAATRPALKPNIIADRQPPWSRQARPRALALPCPPPGNAVCAVLAHRAAARGQAIELGQSFAGRHADQVGADGAGKQGGENSTRREHTTQVGRDRVDRAQLAGPRSSWLQAGRRVAAQTLRGCAATGSAPYRTSQIFATDGSGSPKVALLQTTTPVRSVLVTNVPLAP